LEPLYKTDEGNLAADQKRGERGECGW
jgi:hypothetical protein